MITEAKQAELQANYDAFMESLPALLADHEGEFALMRHRRIVRFFASARDALLHGRDAYSDDLFSVQEVRRAAAVFGCHPGAPDHRPL